MSTGRFSHRPGSVLGGAALGFAVIAMAIAAPRSMLALLGTVAGVLGLTVGLTRGDQRIARGGSFALFVGVLVAGAAGTSAEGFLVATAAALLSWECGLGAFAMRQELKGGTVERAELLHVATSTAACGLVTGGVYVLYRAVSVGVSITAVVLLLVAATLLGLALLE